MFFIILFMLFFFFNVNRSLSLFRKKKLKLYSLWLMYFQINKTLVVLSGCAVPAQTAAGGSLTEPRCWDPSGCSRRDGAGGAAPNHRGLGVPWGFYPCFQDYRGCSLVHLWSCSPHVPVPPWCHMAAAACCSWPENC